MSPEGAIALHSNTFDSEVLTDQVSASLHSAGVASMELFPMATLLALPIWIRVRRYRGHKNPQVLQIHHLGIMRAVQHTDLYLSSTDKCIIDANCWDSLLFGSPFIFPTRWLLHAGSAPGIVLVLKHSAGKQQCCFPLQMYIMLLYTTQFP